MIEKARKCTLCNETVHMTLDREEYCPTCGWFDNKDD